MNDGRAPATKLINALATTGVGNTRSPHCSCPRAVILTRRHTLIDFFVSITETIDVGNYQRRLDPNQSIFLFWYLSITRTQYGSFTVQNSYVS